MFPITSQQVGHEQGQVYFVLKIIRVRLVRASIPEQRNFTDLELLTNNVRRDFQYPPAKDKQRQVYILLKG